MEKIAIIELLLDWNLWPRHKAESLDSTNVKRMKDAIKAGVKLPPIVINKDDKRVIDGFHRVRAYRDLYGEEHQVNVVEKEYESEEAMFLESARINSEHGLPLSPQDRAHVIVKARKMKIPWPALSLALGRDAEELKEFVKKRTAKTQDGETIILSNGASDLSEKGRPLTREEEKHARTANGCKASVNVALLLNALRVNDIVLTDKTVQNLIALRAEIDRILNEVDA